MSDRILIAEDNKNLCRILESALTEAGYDVVVALGGDAAVHEIKSHPFDLVISDMRMPGASGSVRRPRSPPSRRCQRCGGAIPASGRRSTRSRRRS